MTVADLDDGPFRPGDIMKDDLAGRAEKFGNTVDDREESFEKRVYFWSGFFIRASIGLIIYYYNANLLLSSYFLRQNVSWILQCRCIIGTRCNITEVP